MFFIVSTTASTPKGAFSRSRNDSYLTIIGATCLSLLLTKLQQLFMILSIAKLFSSKWVWNLWRSSRSENTRPSFVLQELLPKSTVRVLEASDSEWETSQEMTSENYPESPCWASQWAGSGAMEQVKCFQVTSCRRPQQHVFSLEFHSQSPRPHVDWRSQRAGSGFSPGWIHKVVPRVRKCWNHWVRTEKRGLVVSHTDQKRTVCETGR